MTANTAGTTNCKVIALWVIADTTRRRLLTVTAGGAAAAVAGIPAAAAQTLDAELIELGARFEPLIDRYYVAQRRWSRSGRSLRCVQATLSFRSTTLIRSSSCSLQSQNFAG